MNASEAVRWQEFNVTLPWDLESPSAGDYATTCWAADDSKAVAQVAAEMATEHSDDPVEQAAFIADLVERHKRLPFPITPRTPNVDERELFCVSLPWSLDESGDYQVNVWAINDIEAVRMVASEMAEDQYSEDDPWEKSELDEYIAEHVEHYQNGASGYRVVPVSEVVADDLNELLEAELPEGTSITYERLRSLVLDNLAHFATPAAPGPTPG